MEARKGGARVHYQCISRAYGKPLQGGKPRKSYSTIGDIVFGIFVALGVIFVLWGFHASYDMGYQTGRASVEQVVVNG